MTARVLVVSARQRELEDLRHMLLTESRTWHVEFASTAADALSIMATKPVDMIVTDLHMPGMSGGDLLAEVRRKHGDVGRLILSGPTDAQDFGTLVSLAHQVVRKPCRAEDLHMAIERGLLLRRQLEGERLRSDVSSIDVLPSPPAIFRELTALVESPHADAKSIAALLERDVALASKVLQLANSSFFAARSRVTSLDLAVARLGTRVIRSLVLVDQFQRDFVAPPSVLQWVSRLNHHAHEAAQLARLIARGNQKDDAFCAALLHECGQLVFARSRPGVFAAHLELREERGCSLAEIELETFGFTHAQAGAYLLGLWGFPLEVVDAVGTHDESPADDPAARDVRWAVQVAHRVVEARVDAMCGVPTPELADGWLARLGVADEVDGWAAELAALAPTT